MAKVKQKHHRRALLTRKDGEKISFMMMHLSLLFPWLLQREGIVLMQAVSTHFLSTSHVPGASAGSERTQNNAQSVYKQPKVYGRKTVLCSLSFLHGSASL